MKRNELTTTTGGAIAAPASPLPIYSGAQMAEALTSYKQLQTALDSAMPDQIMDLDGKKFRKKGYWRAVAVAFNLTVETLDERREENGVFQDGRPNFGYVVTKRATAPSGRIVTGDGSCFAVEKARRFKCPHPDPNGWEGKTIHFPHASCPDFDPNFQWRQLPLDATEHNVRGHASTRAYNRAVADLVGFGEVSAEEVMRAGDENERRDDRHGDGGTTTSAANAGATVFVVDVTEKPTKKAHVIKYTVVLSDGRKAGTIREQLAQFARECKEAQTPVVAKTSQSKFGLDLDELSAVDADGGSQARAGTDEQGSQAPSLFVGNDLELIVAVSEVKTKGGASYYRIKTTVADYYTDDAARKAEAEEAARQQIAKRFTYENKSGGGQTYRWLHKMA